MSRRLIQVLAALLLTLVAGGGGGSVRAASPQSYATGQLQSADGLVQFAATVDGAEAPYFELWDSADGQTRNIVLVEATEVACLGDLFGGQTVSLAGTGWDSAAAGERLSIQVFLVDGDAAGPDRLSVKVRRGDRVLYFLPVRDIEAGDIWVSC